MSSPKIHTHTDGKEYKVQTGKLYYLTERQEYELYFGQWQTEDGDEMPEVSVVTGEYVLAPELLVLRVFRTDTSGAIEEHASLDVFKAEVARLNQENTSLRGEVKALRGQLLTQQVSILTEPVKDDQVLVDENLNIGNGFGAQLSQAVEAQERVSA